MKHSISVFFLTFLCVAAAWSQVNLNTVPSRTVGHPVTPQVEQNSLYSASPNLVEGRELYQPEGIAVDTSSTPPAIFVSDTLNNRVLGWKNAASFTNGQMADTVIGQIDFFTTWPQGPGRQAFAPNQGQPLQSGLSQPTGLAVYRGDLYVVDSGNNRVLRYPKPFVNTNHIPDLVIGQQDLSSRTANWTGQVSAQGIFLASGNTVLQGSIAFDKDGNLWLTDAGNRRVLEYAAADVAQSGAHGLSAVLELGQLDMTSTQPILNPGSSTDVLRANQFAVPSGIAFDPHGRLYVSDADANSPDRLSRVLVFLPPFQSNMAATRIMGIFISQTGSTQAEAGATVLDSPSGIFFDPAGQWMGVVDTNYSRILIFPPYEQWTPPSTSTQISPRAIWVAGHNGDFTLRSPNNAAVGASVAPPPSASVFYAPSAAVYFNNELYVADTANNRVIVMPYQSGTIPTFGPATRVLGQRRMDTGAPNYIEGREFNFVTTVDAGIAVDNTGDTPHLFVADTGNNRILGFKDMRKAGPGSPADLIIGQGNGETSVINYPSGDPGRPTSSSLYSPTGLLVDSKGNLWVADRGNGRVLRFPAPFAQTGQPQPDLVLGQSTFSSKVTDPTSSTMYLPYSVAMTLNGSLLVSDQGLNRVLVFQPVNGVFSNGQAAVKVIGQPSFQSASAGSGGDLTAFNGPHHIAVDTDSRLYVADTGNNRVLIFDSLDRLPQFDAGAALTITGLNGPQAIYVSPVTGEVWVGDTKNSKALRYPKYDSILSQGGTPNYTVQMPSYVLALGLDQFGAMVAADATNRISFYFPQLDVRNAASFVAANNFTTFNRPLSPGMFATLFPAANATFSGVTTAQAGAYPLPQDLSDIQVIFNGAPAPLHYVSASQINFYVPMRDGAGNPTPTTGTVDVQIVRKSTGQVLGASTVPISGVAPALYLYPSGQIGNSRTAAAINLADGSINGPNNPAPRGTYVSLYGTGQGFVPNAPPDGMPPNPGQAISAPANLRVFLGSDYLDCGGCAQGDGEIQYSGLGPYVGLWQINIKIPPLIGTGATSAQPLVLMLNSQPSATVATAGYNTVIYVK